MRAYMSDVDGGPLFLDGRGVFTDVDLAFAAEWAEREARAILAETEPAEVPVSFQSCSLGFLAQCRAKQNTGGNGTMLHARIAADMIRDLRAFVED